tara:strand:+ start:394 stop:639 length:246 start_codon:yes stop_codon:yes gene_type:complete
MKGTATISLEDYEMLKTAAEKATKGAAVTKLVTKELQVFLSFLCSRGSIKPFIDEFNRQSTASTIIVENDRARIEFKHNKE